MGTQVTTLLIAFLIQSAPLLEEAVTAVLQLLIDQIPSDAKTARDFHTMCMTEIRLAWAMPDVSEQYRREVAHDAIVIRAREMGVLIDADLFKTLALA